MGFGTVPTEFSGFEPASQSGRDANVFDEFKSSQSDLFTYGIPLVLAGAVDEVGQSIGLLDEEDVNNAINSISTDAGRVYGQNREGFKAAGAIATTLVPILAVPKILRAGKLIDSVFQRSKIGSAVSKALITSGKNHAERIRSLGKNLQVSVLDKSIDIKQNAALIKAIRQEKLGALGDSLKENIATDLAIYGGLSESDILFPSDSPYTNLALYTIPTGLMAAGAYAFTGRAIMKHIASVDGLAAEMQNARNVSGINTTSVLSTKMNRGVEIADASEQIKQAKLDKAEATTTEGSSNALAAEKIQDERLTVAVAKLGKDSVYPKGVGGNFNFPPNSPENLTAASAYIAEPSLAVGAIELVPLTRASESTIPKNQAAAVNSIDKEIKAKLKKIDAIKEGGDVNKTRLQKEVDDLQEQKRLNEDMTAHVIETDNSFVPVPDKRYTVLDEPETVDVRQLKEGSQLSQKDAMNVSQEMGITNTGALVLGDTGKSSLKNQTDEIVHGINGTEVIPAAGLNKESELFSSAAMEDVIVDYSTATATGTKLFNELDDDVLSLLNNKNGFADMTEDQIARMEASFERTGFKTRLRNDIADADGMVPLYTTVKDPIKGFNKLAKFSIKPSTVEGEQVIRKMVFVDDIAGIHKGQVLVKPVDKSELINTKISALRVDEKERLFTAQNVEQRTTSYVLAQKFVDNFKPEGADKLIAHESRTHLELDLQVAVLKKFPDDDTVVYKPNPSLKGQELVDQLEYLSLVKKFKEYGKLRQLQIAGDKGIIKFDDGLKQNEYTMATTLNLPNPTGFGKHPIMDLADALTPSVGNPVPSLRSIGKNLKEVKDQMAALAGADVAKEGISLSGNSLRFNKDAKMKPVIQLSQNRAKNRIGPDELNGLIEADKINRYSMLDTAADANAPMVKVIWDAINENPELFALAKKVDFIVEGTQAGRGVITSAKFANRNSEVIQAMDLIQDIVGRKALQFTSNVFKPHTLVFSRLASNGNDGSLIALNQGINELRNGWDVAFKAVDISNGKKALALEETKRNIDLYKQFFGRDLKKDMADNADGYIPMPVRANAKAGDGLVPTPAVFDDLAFEGLSSITSLSHQFLDNLNHLRKVESLPAINKRNWHVPYYDLKGTSVMHITDMEGRTINMVSGSTEGEALRIANERVKAFGDNGIRSTVQTADFTERHIRNAGGMFEAPTNFGFSGKQTGGIGGKSATPQINIGIDILQNSVKQLQNNFANITRYTNTTAFKGELQYAQLTAASLPASSAREKLAGITQFDEYARTTMQTAGLTDKTGLGKLSYGIESAADMALAKLWDGYHNFIPSTTSASKREFDKFNESVGGGEYNPFKTIEEFLEKTTKVKIPPKIRDLHSKMANFTTAMVLRIFDPGMALLNFASIAAVSPAIVKAMQRGVGEGILEHQRRIGIMGTALPDGAALPSTGRLLNTGLHGLFDPETRAAIKVMKEQGMFKQEVAEKIELITSPIQGYMGRMSDKVIKWLSAPTDWSETMSRQISFAMAYNIGRKSMQLDTGAATTFAQKFANDVVGDYRASNRPQIFQASGMPFGAFTTWSWNFIQRVYGDLEGGRLGAVGTQAAVHAFLFGTESLPGYESATGILTQSYDGKSNLADNLDAAWGPEMMDVVGSGALAQIPRFFGGESINIGGRGSVGLPSIVTANSLTDMVPSLRVAKDIKDGIVALGQSVQQNSGINGREWAETLSTNGVNGALKNFSQIALGYSVDKSGQLVNADTRRGTDVVARIFELKTVSENNKRKEVTRDRLMQEQKAARSRRLNKQLRAASRSEDGITSDLLENVITEGMKQGVSMQQIKASVKSGIIVGQTEITDRNLTSALKQNLDEGRISRLMRFQDDDAIE